MEFTKEEWKDVEEFDNLYQISNTGRLKRKERYVYSSIPYHNEKRKLSERIMSKSNNGKYNFYYVKIYGVRKREYAHRLVAKYFIPNPNNYPEVNHKDLNRLNNNHDNLEWCSRKMNTSHYVKFNNIVKSVSGYTGVSRADSVIEKYSSSIMVDGVDKYLGVYETPRLAAIARDNYIISNNLHNKIQVLS